MARGTPYDAAISRHPGEAPVVTGIQRLLLLAARCSPWEGGLAITVPKRQSPQVPGAPARCLLVAILLYGTRPDVSVGIPLAIDERVLRRDLEGRGSEDVGSPLPEAWRLV